MANRYKELEDPRQYKRRRMNYYCINRGWCWSRLCRRYTGPRRPYRSWKKYRRTQHR